MIVRNLEGGPRRFTELKENGITPKVLTETLRAMQRDGLIDRTEFDELPPRVEYQLTRLGRAVKELLDHTCAWTREHLPEILAAREANHAGTA